MGHSAMYSYVFVALGGALGAMARFALNGWLQRGNEFPWGTLTANLLGCLVMGLIAELVASAAWFTESGFIRDQHRLLFAVGFCGSFTTLSAMVLEINVLLQRSEVLTSFAYLTATLTGGFACFYAGIVIARAMLQWLSPS